MKKNGFTLLELLGVIVLLGVVALLVATLSNRTLKESKESLYETQKETIISAAKKWTIANNEELPMSEAEGEYRLSVGTLAEDGYIDSNEIIDPKTNKEIDACIIITYNNSKNQYNYELVEENC